MFDDDDEDDDDLNFYARQMEDEMIIAQDEYNLQMRNFEREAARNVPSQQNYSYEDLIFDEGEMFERLMDSGGVEKFRIRNSEFREREENEEL